jgi:5-formyltetrahydrofolate cyclo-ligase
MTDIQRKKIHLRSALRQRRNTLLPTQQLVAARAVTNAIVALPNWESAQSIALYLAADGEISTRALEALARAIPKTLFLPRITAANGLCFTQWHAEALLLPNRYNIPEPAESEVHCPASDLDIIFIPTVGWDQYGGQRVAEIPLETWDIVLDYVATDIGLYRCQTRSPC